MERLTPKQVTEKLLPLVYGTGGHIFDKHKIDDQLKRIQEIVNSISEESWDNMVKNSDIADPDFLIEDFDEDTRAIIQAEIAERRRRIRQQYPLTEEDLKKAIKEIDKSKGESDYVIFSSADGMARIDEAMRDMYRGGIDPIDPLPPSKGHASRKTRKVEFPLKWYDRYIKSGVIK